MSGQDGQDDTSVRSQLDLEMLNAFVHDVNEELTIMMNAVLRLREVDVGSGMWLEVVAVGMAVRKLRWKSDMVMEFLGRRNGEGWGNRTENVLERQKCQQAGR